MIYQKKRPKVAGGGLADLIIDTTSAIFPDNPINPEYVTLNEGTPQERTVGPFSRCQRWTSDAMDAVTLINEKGANITAAEKVAAALVISRIVKNMKKEGCPKPSAITQAQWDD